MFCRFMSSYKAAKLVYNEIQKAVFISHQGLSVTEVTEGYEQALKKALDILPGKQNFRVEIV